MRFVLGHAFKGRRSRDYRTTGGRVTDTHGYVQIYDPTHPRAGRAGYVREHIAVAERVLGKPLRLSAVVHHANGDKADNRPDNLVICEDQAYHILLHQRMRAKEACGNPSWLQCSICHRYDAPENLSFSKVTGRSGKPGRNVYHTKCKCDASFIRRHAKALEEGRTLRPRRRG